MRRRRFVLMVAAVTALAVIGAPDAGATPRSKVLPSLPGALWTNAVDINNAGVVIGRTDWTPVRWDALGRIDVLRVPSGLSWAYVDEITDSGFVIGGAVRYDGENPSVRRALLWDPEGGSVDLRSLPGGGDTAAVDVNESGTVTGYAIDADGGQHAVRWDNEGRITPLPVLHGGTFNYAAAINDHGAVAGYSDVVVQGVRTTHAVKWDAAGRAMDLGNPRSTGASHAVDINNADMVTGALGSSPVRWDRFRRVTMLERLPNYPWLSLIEMNDEGMVVGDGLPNVGQTHAIRWDRLGRATELVEIGLGTTRAVAINAAGIVVGNSEYGGNHPGSVRFSTAAKWNPGGTLTYLGEPVGGWNYAASINDRGTICGTSGNNDGTNRQAVIWYR